MIVLGACSSSEHSILITARAAGTGPTVIDNVYFTVIPTASTTIPVDSPPNNPINRTIDVINAGQPIRIAIHLHDDTPVMVHIVATTASGSTRLYATRCYDPAGVVNDEVLLVPLDPTLDTDGDGWPSGANLEGACRDPGPGANGVACDVGLCPAAIAADCNDMAAPMPPVDCTIAANHALGPCIFPGASWPGDCGDGIDQDCRDNGIGGGNRDEPCGDQDGDGFDACGSGGGVCDCDDRNPNVHPGATDICGNGIDEDCTHEPGGMGAQCDNDHDGFVAGPDCDDTNPNIHPGGLELEHCDATPMAGMCGVACRLEMGRCACDGIDNNCNHLIDEDASCQSPDLDGDGSDACTAGMTNCATCDCNDCDSGIHPGATDICGDMIDEDGIGGDMACDPSDGDHDGYTGGQDCDDTMPHFHFSAPENCNTPASESCGSILCPPTVDADHDGFQLETAPGTGTDCDDTNAAITPWATELCNGVDDNCNGTADEVLDRTGQIGCATDTDASEPMTAGVMRCLGGGRCTVHFDRNLHHCGHCRAECNPGNTLVADACSPTGVMANPGRCTCSVNGAGMDACTAGDTCCAVDAHGAAVGNPGCVNTNMDVHHCGGCGNVCDSTATDACVGGTCMCGSGAPCGAGQSCCGGGCVDLAGDVNNCGACGHACGANTTCNAGVCGCANPTVNGDCNGDLGHAGGNGCETNLQTDANFCGSCAQSCLDEHVATGSCSAGACVIGTCETLYADCTGGAANGCETSISTVGNCGMCGHACSVMNADAQCIVAGTTASCGYGMCMGPFGNCDTNPMNGCETSLHQVATCGGCGTNCTSVVQNATATCPSGTCDYSGCAAGASDCDGNRGNGCELYSAAHCGPSCTVCTSSIQNASGATCTGGGTCDYGACNGSTSDCDGNRANGCEAWAPTHCGGSCTNCSTAESGVAAAALVCTAGGACDYTTCSANRSDCDSNRANGCETPSDAMHCGGSCANCVVNESNVNGATCSGTTCDYASCTAGHVDCDGNRTNGCETAADGTHCGAACGTCVGMTSNASGLTCSASNTCDYGSCTGNFLDCDGNRANGCESPYSVTHCGSCASTCTTANMHATGLSCTAGGTCDYTACQAGMVDCDGNRANGCERASDGNHCGPSCTDCEAATNVMTATCPAAVCVITACNGNNGNCDMNPTNGCESTHGTDTNCCGTDCTGMSGMTHCDLVAGRSQCGP